MAKDDPDAQKYVKKLRELQEVENKLKTDRQSLEADANEVKLHKRNKLIEEIAKGYESMDVARLTTLCDKLNLTTKEQIEVQADAIGTKKVAPASPPVPPVNPDSGLTNGGGGKSDPLKSRYPTMFKK
jgi:hypothetical protein